MSWANWITHFALALVLSGLQVLVQHTFLKTQLRRKIMQHDNTDITHEALRAHNLQNCNFS